MQSTYKLFFIISILLISSCRKDIDQFVPQPISDNPNLVAGTVLGKVLSIGGATLGDAQILFHENLTTTDGSGFFFLQDVKAPELEAWLEVNKEGFFPAFSRLAWTAQAELQADMRLIPQNLNFTFSAEEGGEWMSASLGIGLEIPADALQYSTGDPASGEVQIYAHWANPTDPDFQEMVPMASKALDMEGNARFLQSFGVIALEITDANGLPLDLAPGKIMDLFFPVVNSQSPATVPLWAFNSADGVWEEQTIAARTGMLNELYLAKTSGGDYFWNVASSQPLVQVKGWVHLPEGSPATGVQIQVEDENGLLLAQRVTQNQGQFVIELPANTPATLKLFNLCGQEQHVQELPSLTSNVSLNPIQWSGNEMVSVKGKLLDCEENPVSQGFIQILWADQEMLIPLQDGAFSAHLPVCTEEVITLIGHDLDRNYQTLPLSFSTNSPVDAGDWILCNDTPEYISYNLDGAVQFSSAPELQIDGDLTTISDLSLGLSLSFEATTPGTFQVLSSDFLLGALSSQSINSLDLILNISRFDPPGGYVIGSFNGNAVDSNAVAHQISGVFKLQHD